MNDTVDYTAAIIALEETLRTIKAHEALKDGLTVTIKEGLDTGNLDDETIKTYGVVPNRRSGNYDEGAISVCKKHGLDDAWGTKETLVQSALKEHVEAGRVPAEELEPFKKPDSFFLSLPRGSK